MSSSALVTIHASQFPDAARRDLLQSLRTRRVNHKFHYDSLKQTQEWLALHQALSPSRNDADVAAMYDQGFAGAVSCLAAPRAHVIGLGCGGGQKDHRLLQRLRGAGKGIFYTPCDVSVAMTLVARQTALDTVPEANCFPFVCDLATAEDLPAALGKFGPPDAARLVTFFGMIPNFEPGSILPKLAGTLRPADLLLFSANLVPGPEYAAGVQRILLQYDNPPTHEWLMTFLLDLGVERDDGDLRFSVEENAELRRVVARFCFARSRRIEIGGDTFQFRAGEAIQLFFSYRYTADLVRETLARHGLRVLEEWVAKSEEEGLFLVEQNSGSAGHR